MSGKEVAREIGIFGGEPHLAFVLEPECGRHIIEIGHGAHVDPGLRNRDDNIGEAKSQSCDQNHALFGLRDHFADKILAGDAEMRGALAELSGNFGGR